MLNHPKVSYKQTYMWLQVQHIQDLVKKSPQRGTGKRFGSFVDLVPGYRAMKNNYVGI